LSGLKRRQGIAAYGYVFPKADSCAYASVRKRVYPWTRVFISENSPLRPTHGGANQWRGDMASNMARQG
jgi:hypothetical protein